VKIRVLLFATYRDLAGRESVEVEVAPLASAADVVSAVRALGDRFADLPERPAVARNLRYVPLETELAPGDELAFIPPVAGG
jgi:molybdopterin converting factor small subunit